MMKTTENMKTRDKILLVAKELVAQKGAKSVTVLEVAAQLDITHQAAYKHFKSKKQLMESLALLWLDEILEPVFHFQGSTVHGWLWTLACCKKQAYEQEPEMFTLYTHYISTNAELEELHNQHLVQSLIAVTTSEKYAEYDALIRAFLFFQHPAFASQWDETFQEKFERCWSIMATEQLD